MNYNFFFSWSLSVFGSTYIAYANTTPRLLAGDTKMNEDVASALKYFISQRSYAYKQDFTQYDEAKIKLIFKVQ